MITLLSFGYKSNIIKWNRWSDLSWESFQSVDTVSVFGAGSSIGINYTYFDRTIISYTYFDCQKSWVKKYAKTDNVLQHEIYHFHIAEIERRKFLKDISSLKDLNPLEMEKIINIEYLNTLLREDSIQRKYDKETDFCNDTLNQSRWMKSIDSALICLEEFNIEIFEIN